MKVLIVKSHYVRAGGPETLLASILQQWDRDNFEYILLALSNDSRCPLSFTPDQAFKKFPEKYRVITWNGLVSLPRAILQLAKLVKTTQPQVIYTHDMRANLVAFFVSLFSPVPWVAHVHGWLGKTAILKTRIYEWIDQKVIHRAEKVLVGSEYLKAKMLGQHGISRVEVAPNSVDLNAYHDTIDVSALRESLFPGFNGLVVGAVCRLHRGKGVHTLIEAFARVAKIVPDIRCLVVGEGPEKDSLLQLVRDLEIEDRVVFTGYVKDVLPYLRLIQLYILASFQESLPVSLLEALAFGIPAIGTDVGDVGRVLDFGKEHLLVPPRDVDRLSQAMTHLCQNSELRKSLGKKGSEVIKSNYSLPVVIKQIQSILKEVGSAKL